MSFTAKKLKQIVDAILMAVAKPMTIEAIQALFLAEERPAQMEIEAAILALQKDCKTRGFDLVEVAGGWRFQVKQELSPWVSRLWEEKPQKYSRALLETLALVAYRQPITRGEIEEVRGVAVSSQIIKTLAERNWIKVIGYKDVPGRPAMYATTKDFLDYFNLRSLNELPHLMEARDLDVIARQLDLTLLNEATAADDENSEIAVDEAAVEQAENITIH